MELKAVEKQLGSCVKKARPYYEARSKYRYEKELALRASERFEHAVSFLSPENDIKTKLFLNNRENQTIGQKLFFQIIIIFILHYNGSFHAGI